MSIRTLSLPFQSSCLPGWLTRKSTLTSMQLQEKNNIKLHVLKKTESTSLPPFESSGSLNLYYFYTTRPNWQFSWRRVANPNHTCPDICRQLLGKGHWLLTRYILSLNCQKRHAGLWLLLLSPVSLIYLIHPKSKSFVDIKMVTYTYPTVHCLKSPQPFKLSISMLSWLLNQLCSLLWSDRHLTKSNQRGSFHSHVWVYVTLIWHCHPEMCWATCIAVEGH